MSNRVFQLAREHWKNRTIISNGFRRTYWVECCPIIISTETGHPTELGTESNCHIIETISRYINTTEPPNVSVRKDQVCK